MVHNENHHFELHHMLHSNMSKLYASQAVLTFVKSMIGIFVPIYLFSLGFSLNMILFYGVGLSAMFLVGVPLAVKIINKIGFKYTLLATVPIYIIHIASLNYIKTEPLMFHIAWITFGLYNSIFWPAFHAEIAVNGHRDTRGKEIGTLQIISTIFATLAPLIGGFVLEFLGYYSLLIVSTILLFVSVLPLMFSQDIKIYNYHFGFKDYIRLAKDKKFENTKKVFMFEGIEHALSLLLWPVVLYIILSQNFFKFGILLTVISLISVAMISYMKSYIDKHRREKVLKIITRFMGAGWLLRSIVVLFFSVLVYIVESLTKLIFDVFRLTYISIFYNNATSSKSYMDYIILREFYLHRTRIVFILLLAGILEIFGDGFGVLALILLFGIIGSIGMSYYREDVLEN